MNDHSEIVYPWFAQILACPDCGNKLTIDVEVLCQACAYTTSWSLKDFRPINPSAYNTTMPRQQNLHPEQLLEDLDVYPPTLTYNGPVAERDSAELFSEIQKFLMKGDRLLDLGCGPRDQYVPSNHLGYEYVGGDYSNSNADILLDAHAIPFVNNSFDCILSYAVLEHLHNPVIALHEIMRTLKPGGIYVGTVSLGEPFHDSYFHHTAWGVLSLVATTKNMEVIHLWPSRDTLAALASMGRYPRVVRGFISIIDKLHRNFPILAPRKMQWSKRKKALDKLHLTGSVCFVIKKVDDTHNAS